MYRIIYNKKISPSSFEIAVLSPMIIDKFTPGQFAIVMTYEDSERIPLTIYDYDKEKGILYLIYQVVGASTLELSNEKKYLFSVSGPLGNANEICKNYEEYRNKRIVYVAGGVGIAPVYPQVKFLKSKGFDIDVIYGARNREELIIRNKLCEVSRRVFFATDDGSYGKKGFVTDELKKRIKDYDICVSIGPVIMMKMVSLLTKEYGIKTIVSMNPLMVDGSGMCGACRCEVDGKSKFACTDGPEFDAHKVNFDLALKRMNIYKEEEKIKLDEMKKRKKNG